MLVKQNKIFDYIEALPTLPTITLAYVLLPQSFSSDKGPPYLSKLKDLGLLY